MALRLPIGDIATLLYDAVEFTWLRGDNAEAVQFIAHAIGVAGNIEGVGLF